MFCEIWMVRHGRTSWNKELRFQGHSDIPLDEEGLRQAEDARVKLTGRGFHAVYSSDLQRARQTAEIMVGNRFGEIIVDPLLREVHLGEYEGMTVSQVRTAAPEFYAAFRSARPDFKVPGGESYEDLVNRVVDRLHHIAEKHVGEQVLVVTHGGVIAAAMRHALPEPLRGETLKIKNTSVTRFRVRPQGRFLEVLESEAIDLKADGATSES